MLFRSGQEIPAGEVVARLTPIYAGRPDKTIFLEADRSHPHGRIVDLMDDCRAAGIVRIGMVTRKETTPPPGGWNPGTGRLCACWRPRPCAAWARSTMC